jgi:hypothetical protein
MRYTHESAYLLAKGHPPMPEQPLDDVLSWKYSGNHSHPTEKSVETLKPIIDAFTKAGDIVLDPFAGSGSSLVAAALLGRRYTGIELEEKYCDLARRRLAGAERYAARPQPERRRPAQPAHRCASSCVQQASRRSFAACSPLESRAGLPSVPMSKIVYFLGHGFSPEAAPQYPRRKTGECPPARLLLPGGLGTPNCCPTLRESARPARRR